MESEIIQIIFVTDMIHFQRCSHIFNLINFYLILFI